MNIENNFKNNRILQNWNGLGSSARWFIFHSFLYSVFISGWSLFYNFFILSRGFDIEFLGIIRSIPSIATLVVGIPIGLMADRIGRKKSIVIGMLLATAGMLAQAVIPSQWIILVMAFIGGIGLNLYGVNMNPMLVRLSNKKNRNMLFSLNWSMLTLAGVVGLYLAGLLPGWLESITGIQPETLESYKMILIISVSFTALSLIPILLMDFEETRHKRKTVSKGFPDLRLLFKNKEILKLSLPNLTVGIGAAMLVPYLNLFFADKFQVDDLTLGTYFSLASLVTGISTLFGPMLVKRVKGRIRAVTVTQTSSLVFLIILGFSPWQWLAVVGFLLRGALMNMAMPLWDAFVMEQVEEDQQATMASIQRFTWEFGWATVPYISTVIQGRMGFTPLFIITGIFYALTSITTFGFFQHKDKEEAAAELEATPA